ncbi:M48 family metallopeptidase [Leptothermofonsia sichuanensis E412]|uniref:M48 family metalloprotease n=1 Tax=Leptothermofonsia sichuanensis TaxID=2917832 RepID=UPI001CA756F8|nr:M48 family metalloprotease [Leptothermofonsia sichuanensis]QZZ18899.1 M48 family metallopeptidase [Leptothermofonsia sichuanensis E412]
MPTYTGISSAAFRHPLDRQAEQTLRSVPGFDLVASKFVDFLAERPQFVFRMGNSIQVGPRQYANIYQIFRDCLRDLDVYPEPSLFVSQSPLVNAFALGREHPCITINTGLLDLLNEAELRSVIAHELGHIKCGHSVLIQMAIWTTLAVSGLARMTFGFSELVSTGLLMAFYEWLRKAELSADRASLLVMDDQKLVMSTMMKMAGGSSRHSHELSLDEFIRQSERYQELDYDGLNQVYKFLLYNNLSQGIFLTHPFTVERVTFLREWAMSEEYKQIRSGNYQRAGAEGSVEVEVQSDSEASSDPQTEVDSLRRQIEELQQEIDRIKRSR